jgi:hypothetical protein
MNESLMERVIAACEEQRITHELIDECSQALDQPVADRFDLIRYIGNLNFAQINYASVDLLVLIQEAKEKIASGFDSL